MTSLRSDIHWWETLLKTISKFVFVFFFTGNCCHIIHLLLLFKLCHKLCHNVTLLSTVKHICFSGIMQLLSSKDRESTPIALEAKHVEEWFP